MDRRSSLNGRLSLSTTNLTSPIAESTHIGSFNQRFPWGGVYSPVKMSNVSPNSKTLDNRTAQLSNTMQKIDPRVFTDVQSQGLASRVVKYYENSMKLNRSASCNNLYSKPGQFPVVHLKKNEIPYKSCRNRNNVSIVRIAPPDKSVFQANSRSSILRSGSVVPTVDFGLKSDYSRDNRPILHENLENEIAPTRSVLEALKEISRKRINSDELDCNDGIKKYCKDRNYETSSNLTAPLNGLSVSISNLNNSHQTSSIKRQRELNSPSSSPTAKIPNNLRITNVLSKPTKKINNEFTSSLSSSLSLLTPKRKYIENNNQSRESSPTTKEGSPTSSQPRQKQKVSHIAGTSSFDNFAKKGEPSKTYSEPIYSNSSNYAIPSVAKAKPKVTLFNKKYDDSETKITQKNYVGLPEDDDDDDIGTEKIQFVKPKDGPADKNTLTKNTMMEKTQKTKLALMLSGLRGDLYEDMDETDAAHKNTTKEAQKPQDDSSDKSGKNVNLLANLTKPIDKKDTESTTINITSSSTSELGKPSLQLKPSTTETNNSTSNQLNSEPKPSNQSFSINFAAKEKEVKPPQEQEKPSVQFNFGSNINTEIKSPGFKLPTNSTDAKISFLDPKNTAIISSANPFPSAPEIKTTVDFNNKNGVKPLTTSTNEQNLNKPIAGGFSFNPQNTNQPGENSSLTFNGGIKTSPNFTFKSNTDDKNKETPVFGQEASNNNKLSPITKAPDNIQSSSSTFSMPNSASNPNTTSNLFGNIAKSDSNQNTGGFSFSNSNSATNNATFSPNNSFVFGKETTSQPSSGNIFGNSNNSITSQNQVLDNPSTFSKPNDTNPITQTSSFTFGGSNTTTGGTKTPFSSNTSSAFTFGDTSNNEKSKPVVASKTFSFSTDNTNKQSTSGGFNFGESKISGNLFENKQPSNQSAFDRLKSGEDSSYRNNNVFGSSKVESSSNIFGSNAASNNNSIFGNSNNNQASNPIFGNSTSNTSNNNSPVFGKSNNSSVFGNANSNATNNSTPVFGNANSNATNNSSSVFGNANNSNPNNVFGNTNSSATNNSNSVFGNANSNNAPNTNNPIFGNTNLTATKSSSSIFGNSNGDTSNTNNPIFGNTKSSPFSKSSENIFKSANTNSSSNIFGNNKVDNSSKFTFGQTDNNKKDTNTSSGIFSFGGGTTSSTNNSALPEKSTNVFSFGGSNSQSTVDPSNNNNFNNNNKPAFNFGGNQPANNNIFGSNQGNPANIFSPGTTVPTDRPIRRAARRLNK